MEFNTLLIAALPSVVAVGIAVWSRKNTNIDDIYNKLEHKIEKSDCVKSNDDMWAAIDSKVDEQDHYEFSKRIGRQVDKQDIVINKVEKCLAYMVGKNGGDYQQVVGS